MAKQDGQRAKSQSKVNSTDSESADLRTDLTDTVEEASKNEINNLARKNEPDTVVPSMEQRNTMATPSILSELDFYLLGEGKHWQSYEKLGAHLRTVEGVSGVNFVVWAPNAKRVSVIGDFNCWNAEANVMYKHIPSGFWEVFVPGIGIGNIYKYHVEGNEGTTERADPVGFFAERPPRTASIVADLDHYDWHDDQWLANRKKDDTNWLHTPISVYEVHLGSWQRSPDDPEEFLSYRDLAPRLVEYVKEMGYTHIEFLPVAEHPLSASWGYQIIGMYAVTSRFGRPEDFMYLVDLCHQNGIGVIVDWVPAHFPKDMHGLRRFDGTALYEHADPRQGEHRDWGTLIFNYGRNEVTNYLVSNALFWLDKYHVDGLRVDAVASMLYLDYSREPGDWVPNEYGGRENLDAIRFLQSMNQEAHGRYTGILTIAEESTAWPGVSRPVYAGGLGFSMKWNMGWMNDTLKFMKLNPVYRKYHHDSLTFSMVYAFSENFILPISHDEVVHGKGTIISNAPGDQWQKFANARLLYSYMWTHPGKKLLFMGCDFGQWSEWNFDRSLDWHLLQYGDTHGGLKRCVSDLNALYRKEKALHERDFDWQGFQWIDCHNWEESTFAYMRVAQDEKDYLVIVANFTPVARKQRIGVPEAIQYEEIFCSDSPWYGGSGTGNGVVQAINEGAHNRPASFEVLLPPLGVSIFKPQRS